VGAGAEFQAPLFAALGPLHHRGRALRVGKDASGLAQEQLPGLGQLDGAARPDQERPAQLAFQVLDLLRERRLGDAEALRGAPEVPLLGDGDEVTEVAQLHA
jgi:hypothetical protein